MHNFPLITDLLPNAMTRLNGEVFPKLYSGDFTRWKKRLRQSQERTKFQACSQPSSWGAPVLFGIVPVYTGKKHRAQKWVVVNPPPQGRIPVRRVLIAFQRVLGIGVQYSLE